MNEKQLKQFLEDIHELFIKHQRQLVIKYQNYFNIPEYKTKQVENGDVSD